MLVLHSSQAFVVQDGFFGKIGNGEFILGRTFKVNLIEGLTVTCVPDDDPFAVVEISTEDFVELVDEGMISLIHAATVLCGDTSV